MDFGSIFDDYQSTPLQGVGDFHLRSALQWLDLEKLENGEGKWREVNSYKRILAAFPLLVLKHVVLSSIISDLVKEEPEDQKERIQCYQDLLDSLKLEHKALKKMMSSGDPMEKVIQAFEEYGFETEYSNVKKELTLGMMWCLAKNSKRDLPYSETIKVHQDYGIHRVGKMTFFYFGELIALLRVGNTDVEIMSLDHFRMIVDKMTERDNVLIATTIGHSVFPQAYPKPNLLRSIFLLFDNHLKSRGNDGYKLLKTYEALVQGVILSLKPSNYWDSSLFLNSTIQGIDEIDKSTAQSFICLLRLTTSVHQLTQICGLFRLWGHPLINSEEGIKKVKTIGDVKKIINPHVAKMAERSFKEIFYLNFYNKNGRYPNHIIESNDESEYLYKCLRSGVRFNASNYLYDFSSWDQVDTGKTFDIPETFNLSMIVADTAISPTRKELLEAYNAGKPAMEATTRRGVLKWMKDGMIDCGTLLRKIDEHPIGLPKNHLAVGLYPKEREMNPVARMFALTTLLMRSYIVVTESMLSENVLDYIPGITMTHSLLKLTKEMVKVTWRQKDASEISKTFCINMDFEKWNLNMREEATYGVFSELGKLFGLLTLYNKTYSIFKNSLIYLADGTFIPAIDENTLDPIYECQKMYLGHGGGFEGLRQKGWTIFTVVMISKICQRLNIDWQLMGQGDNQVLMVTIYSKWARRGGISSKAAEEDIKSQLNNLMKELISEFQGVGLPLKPLETWISDSFFSYGKTPLYQGLPCASSLKKISRIFYFSNEDLMTLDNALGAVGANAQSAVMGDVHPIIPYVIAKWQQLMCIHLFRRYHPLIGKGLDAIRGDSFTMRNKDTGALIHHIIPEVTTKKLEYVTSLVPKTLGGYNVLNYFRMMMRGFPDPQNMDYQWLNSLYLVCEDSELRGLIENILILMLNPEINYSYLMQDVTGLNLYVPTNSTQVVKDMIHKTIDGLDFRSEFSSWFKVVLKHSEKETIEELVSYLCKGEEINVRLAHDIIGSSVYGYCDSITSKIDKTVTLSRMALGQEDVVKSLIKNEIRFFEYWNWRLSVSGNLSRSRNECPSFYIRKARLIGWRKRLIGVDVPFPFHFIVENEHETDRPDSFVQLLINEMGMIGMDNLLCTVGRALPYLGSMTKEKLISNPKQVSYGAEPLLTRPLRLLRIIGWFVSPGSNIAKLISDLVRAVSDLNPEEFTVKQERIKGSMAHRYKDDGTKHGSLWMPLFGPATFINISTNHFLQYSKGSKNVTLHFQALLCYLQYIAVNKMMAMTTIKKVDFYRGCPSCITDLQDEFEDLPLSVPLTAIPSCPENPYLYITSDRIPTTIKEGHSFHEVVPSVDLDTLPELKISKMVSDWLARKITISLLSVTDKSFDRGLIDIGGIPRTIFLKADPTLVLGYLTGYLWVMFGRQAKYQKRGVHPSWQVMKPDILRTLARTSSSSFIHFGGFFLWEESKNIIESRERIVHRSYPMTASSICDVSKDIIMKNIQKTDEVEILRYHIMIDGDESHFEIVFKSVMISRVLEDDLFACSDCMRQIFLEHIDSKTDIFTLLSKKCNHGHHLYPKNEVKRIYRIPNISIEAVADVIPSHMIQRGRSNEDWKFGGKVQKVIPYHAISQYDYIMMGDTNTDHPHLPKLDVSQRFTGIKGHFSAVSRGLYRIGELHMVIPGSTTDDLLVLGDGYGGTSLGARIFGDWNSITSWTYIDVSEGIPHSSTLSKPPLHFNYNLGIDDSPSFYEVSLIGHSGFRQSFPRVVERRGIRTVISDVEWWYVGEDHSTELIDLCHTERINTLYLRVYLGDISQLVMTIESAVNSYRNWRLVFTDSCSPFNNSAWLILSGPHECKTEKHLYPNSIEHIDRSLRIRVEEYIQDAQDGLMVESLDGLLLKVPGLLNYYEEMVSSYFWKAEITDFVSESFTVMYLALRTGRRPESVIHMTDSKIYYERDNIKYNVMLRLILIAFSMMNDLESLPAILDRRWELAWQSYDVHTSDIQRYIKTNIKLVNNPNLPSNISRKDQREILSYVTLLQGMRERRQKREDVHRFSNIGKEIKFKYVPKHDVKKQRDVFFHVSKVLSYNLV
ncbi:TPA_asm: L [Chrysanthemum betacytorhabdovirus 1]|nr:TPA_asm: L [Chrysanthemum betacytorhabdovirus 1]